MLLLLTLVHLLTKNGSAAPLRLSLAPRTSTDTCDDINNCRRLFDIVWGCFATIFACTWVSVHPNVPPPDQSRLALLWRRLKMMLIGIIAPEIMVGFAAGQFFGARMLSKGMSEDSFALKFISITRNFTECGFSRTHAFFFCMGGFISSTGYPVVTKEQLEDPDLGPEFLKGIRNISPEDIADKSKSDALSKSVALGQGIWFTTQCLARVHQRLVVTELEVTTLAFAVVNIFIWLLWWDKPLDVQRQIVVGPARPQDAQPIKTVPMSRWDRFLYAIFGTETTGDYNPLSSTSVRLFWSLPMGDKFLFGTTGITAVAGTVFGAIHCAAWTLDFPTAAEMWMWRSCSLLMVAVPPVTFLASLLVEKTKLGKAIRGILLTVFFGSLSIYVAARLIVIPYALMALRSVPPSAFMDINWSTYILHI